MSNLRLVLAQLNFTVGDISANVNNIKSAIQTAKENYHADLIIFPELAVSGYPPEDLLLRPHFYERTDAALDEIKECAFGIDVLIGYPEKTKEAIYNSAIWLRDKQCIINYRKQKLPNYAVFDEMRYFSAGNAAGIADLKGVHFGVLICEDIWYSEPVNRAKQAGADCILCLNSSPYYVDKFKERLNVIKKRINESHLPIVYVNTVGGQDELIFAGDSQVIDQAGRVAAHSHYFEQQLLCVEMDSACQFTAQRLPPIPESNASIYSALKLGVRDYTGKNGFNNAIVAVSGGIDSALTLTVAADALGADHVTALFMPSRYTSDLSRKNVEALTDNLGVSLHTLPIDAVFESYLNTLSPLFKDQAENEAEQNLQARIRGALLMAVSNKFGQLVLTTGNKSELAVGYTTLYGDMAGGFCVLKDVYKTVVYKLAAYRNKLSLVIPQACIDRPPSAELAPNQTDQDTLPAYNILDEILKRFIEENKSAAEIVADGFDAKTVQKTVRMIVSSQHKRRQAPPGPRITSKGLDKDWRYPVTCGNFSFA